MDIQFKRGLLDISVLATEHDGRFEVTTSTGDIRLSISGSDQK